MEYSSLRGERSLSREPEPIAGPPDHRAGGARRLYSFAAQRVISVRTITVDICPSGAPACHASSAVSVAGRIGRHRCMRHIRAEMAL